MGKTNKNLKIHVDVDWKFKKNISAFEGLKTFVDVKGEIQKGNIIENREK